jgi:hypothetical protein
MPVGELFPAQIYASLTRARCAPLDSALSGANAWRQSPNWGFSGYQYSGAKCTKVLPRCSVQSWKACASLMLTRFSVLHCGHCEVATRSPGIPVSVINSGRVSQTRHAKLASTTAAQSSAQNLA